MIMREQRLVRTLAGAIAIVIVAGTFVVMGGTSDAHYRAALAAAGGPGGMKVAELAIEPARIDVVVVRDSTRTAARIDERARPRS